MLFHKAAMLNYAMSGCSHLCCSSLRAYNDVNTSGPTHFFHGTDWRGTCKSIFFRDLMMSAFFEVGLPSPKEKRKHFRNQKTPVMKGSFTTADFKTKFVDSQLTRVCSKRAKNEIVDTKVSNLVQDQTILDLSRSPHLVISTASTNKDINPNIAHLRWILPASCNTLNSLINSASRLCLESTKGKA